MIGNSRLHWAWFKGSQIQRSWDTPHLSDQAIDRLIAAQLQVNACPDWDALELDLPALPPALPINIASVVPARLPPWQTYSKTQIVTLDDIPLPGKYPTLGIDRALAVWGAAQTAGLPVLVIDGGTALTYTGADAAGRLVGGAILPGLALQMRALNQHTAALPAVDARSLVLPERWSLNTPDAIRSGVFYMLLAGLKEAIDAWRSEFPAAAIVLTGGDGALLLTGLQQRYADWASSIRFDPHLIFWGMRRLATQ